MIDLDEAALLLRGWADEARSVRVVFTGRDVKVGAPTCEVFAASADSVAFKGGDGVVLEFFLRGCLAEFADAPDRDDKVESAIVFKGSEVNLFVMLLTV
jgi:hypothetical protein